MKEGASFGGKCLQAQYSCSATKARAIQKDHEVIMVNPRMDEINISGRRYERRIA
jgi:xanthine dehydrogenase molybdopterin-binding subunit B